MSIRTNPPWKTTVLLLLVAGLGWLAYEYVYVRRIFKTETKTFLAKDQLDQVRGAILKHFAGDPCLAELGPMGYRARDNCYRIEVYVRDGCEEQAKLLCREIADLVEDEVNRDAQVWAYSANLTLIARYLP